VNFTDYSSPTTYQLSGVGDTDANGFADLIWFEPATGQVAVWLMGSNGMTSAFPASVGPGAWRPYGIGDLDGDGRADILWRNQSAGNTAVWYMSGGVVSGTQSFVSVPINAWQFGAIADLDLDGRGDIVWFSGGGDVVRWRMQGRGLQPVAESLTSVGPGWSLVP
jgi:hypothetical protein